jgi:putative peptidoglycan lipid II flippase
MATALSALINMSLLYRGLHIANVYRLHLNTIVFVMKLILSGVMMSIFLSVMSGDIAQWLSWGVLERGLALAGLIVAGALVYMISGGILGIRLRHIMPKESGERDIV